MLLLIVHFYIVVILYDKSSKSIVESDYS